jgi:uncharacterized repeat protein (TIGR01451 family)
MKRFSIADLSAVLSKRAVLGTIALLAVVPLTGAIPGVPSISVIGSAIAQNIQKQPQMHLQLDAEKQVVSREKANKQTKASWEFLKGEAIVRPGDMLRYTVSGENFSSSPVKNLTLNQAIPKTMGYVLNSANANIKDGVKITYSIDGGQKFVEKPTVKVTLPNGKEEERPAPASAYTNIRWKFDTAVAPKTTVKASYQAQVH